MGFPLVNCSKAFQAMFWNYLEIFNVSSKTFLRLEHFVNVILFSLVVKIVSGLVVAVYNLQHYDTKLQMNKQIITQYTLI